LIIGVIYLLRKYFRKDKDLENKTVEKAEKKKYENKKDDKEEKKKKV